MLSVAVAQANFEGTAIYVVYCCYSSQYTSGFLDDVIFYTMGAMARVVYIYNSTMVPCRPTCKVTTEH